MKLECVKEKLADAVQRAEKITSKNPTLPVLSAILLEVKGGSLFIRATNLDLGVEIEIPVKVSKEGICAVPAGVIASFLANVQNDKNITLELDESNLVVSTSKAVVRVNTTPYEDFPIIPRLSKEKGFPFNSEDFIKGLRSVWYSASNSSVKPELASVYVYSDADKGEIVFVATDSFRLAEKRIKSKKKANFDSVLIPFKNIPEIIRVLEASQGDIVITIEEGQIAFFLNSTYLVSRVIDATFPDYKQIIPKDIKTEVVILKQDIFNTLKLAHVFSDTFNLINFSLLPGKKVFEIKTKNSNVGESVNKLDAVVNGEDLTINFNYKYIFDCFQSINSDSVELSFSGLSRPLIVKGVSDKSFLYLVMPMNK